MNKYMGFYELKDIRLPTVPWKLFAYDTVLDGSLLWTVRVAVENSNDLNLPRAVGVDAGEAMQKGREFLDMYEGKGIVVYYPYFIAQKSGVLDVNNRRTVIEAVEKDLWNLVTHGRKNLTIIYTFGNQEVEGKPERKGKPEMEGKPEGGKPGWEGKPGGAEAQYDGDRNFLGDDEVKELLGYASALRGRFRDELCEGKSILAEWSYAYNTDIRNEPIGQRYLVFYELREL